MQPLILLLSYIIEILKISQDNVTRNEILIALSVYLVQTKLTHIYLIKEKFTQVYT